MVITNNQRDNAKVLLKWFDAFYFKMIKCEPFY